MPLKFKKSSAINEIAQPNLAIQIFKLIVALIVIGITVVLAATLFIYLLIGAVLVFGYFWWKTRALRREMKNRASPSVKDENTIEGEVIRQSNSAHE
jgi:ABC-type bacteriocin/lantibiotic exporter with double-glycine peptidase domain